jgi:hypothetical protein
VQEPVQNEYVCGGLVADYSDGRRLWSLWEIMKQFNAAYFAAMSMSVSGLYIAGSNRPLMEGFLWGNRYKEWIKQNDHRVEMDNLLAQLSTYCIELELTASVASIGRIRLVLARADFANNALDDLWDELRTRLVDELQGRFFWSLTANEARHYSNPTEGWAGVLDRFPAATTDIEEMNKCFALSRYAGAVFHSVQAIECGLIDFGKFLKVNDPKSGWTAVNGRLATLVTKNKYAELEPLYQEHFTFLEQMHGTVGALNGAWRNKISHAQGRLTLMTSEFSSEVAEEIMISSRSFMRRLATELPKREGEEE